MTDTTTTRTRKGAATKASMATKASTAAKAAKGSALTKALPAGAVTMAKVRTMVGRYETLGAVTNALAKAETVEDYSKALAMAKVEVRDPAAIAKFGGDLAALKSEVTKAADAHTSLRQSMVRAHLRWFPTAQDFDLAVELFGANPDAAKPERDAAKAMVRRIRNAVKIVDAAAEWNLKADSVGEPKRSISPAAAAKAANAVEKITGESVDTVVSRVRTGQELLPETTKAATGGAVVSALTTLLARCEALEPKGLTEDQAKVVRESIAALVKWSESMPVAVTVSAIAS